MKRYLAYLLLTVSIWACKKQPGKAETGTVTPPIAVVDTSKASWWKKAKFGMFIHWGVYSVPAGVYNGKNVDGLGEWIMNDAKIPVATYKDFAKQFNPTDYNPEAWVQMAKAAGMKYIVITTKHHDGFALFDSKYSDWNVVKATPYGKDLIRPLADACRKYGMKIGFYYSQANDWGNKGGEAQYGHWDPAQDGSMDDYLDKVAVPQVREILSNYGDIAELWWDVPTGMTPARVAKFTPLLALQPKMLTNNRLAEDRVGGDFDTPEQTIPGPGKQGLWETCMTVNDTWGFKTNDNNWKSSATLIRDLIEISSLGGNFLLNVGPEASGKFPPAIVSRLADIGKWMDVNNEAIYETTASVFKVLPWGKSTTKVMADGNTALYLHVFNWPADGKLLVPGLGNEIISATFLANGKAVKYTKDGNGLTLSVPASPVDATATVIKLIVKGAPNIGQYVQPAEADGSIVLYPAIAETQNPSGGDVLKAEGDAGNENLGYWTDARSFATWHVMVPKAGTYTVETTLTTPGNSSTIYLSTGNETLKKLLPTTGGWDNYTKVTLGTLKFTSAGVATIKLSADEAGWSPVNMRKIVLRP